MEIVQTALNKYPKDILENNLFEIYVLKSLSFYGQPFGGTSSNNQIFITNAGRDKGYDSEFIERAFHHEFSSILLRNYFTCFNSDQWEATNTGVYGTGGINAIKTNQASKKIDQALLRRGFLYQYATSSLENDFNAFAENLFAPNEAFEKIIDSKMDKILQKYIMAIEFYYCIHPHFDEVFFNGLRK